MPEISKEVVALLTYLLPGFLVAWIFFALTPHQKPVQLERIIQALIFTLLVNALVAVEKLALFALGKFWNLGLWDKDSDLVASVVTALALGLLVSYLANGDRLHALLRKLGLSSRSSMPNEWCTVFSPRDQFVVLHLKDERRLFGWPKVWPSDPEKGHLFVTQPSWVHGPDGPIELSGTEGVLVPIKDVAHVEFVEKPKE